MNSPAECKTHFQVHQTDCRGPSAELDAFVKLSEQRLDISKGVSCPLCQDTLYSLKQYQQHVGRHQEQLSLFALPSVEGEEPDEDDNDEDIDSNEAASANSDVLNLEEVPKVPEKQQSLEASDDERSDRVPLSPRSVPDNEIEDWELRDQDASDKWELERAHAELAILRKQYHRREEEKWASKANHGTGVLLQGDESDEVPMLNNSRSTETKPGLFETEEDPEEELALQQKRKRDNNRSHYKAFLWRKINIYRDELLARGENPHELDVVVRKAEIQNEWEPSVLAPDREIWQLEEAGDALRSLLMLNRHRQSASKTTEEEETLGEEVEADKTEKENFIGGNALPDGAEPGFPMTRGAAAGIFAVEWISSSGAAEDGERKEYTDEREKTIIEQSRAAQKAYRQRLLLRSREMLIKSGENPDEIDTIIGRAKDEFESLKNHEVFKDPEIWVLERAHSLLMEPSGKTHQRERDVDREQEEQQSGRGKPKVDEEDHMYQEREGQLGDERENNFGSEGREKEPIQNRTLVIEDVMIDIPPDLKAKEETTELQAGSDVQGLRVTLSDGTSYFSDLDQQTLQRAQDYDLEAAEEESIAPTFGPQGQGASTGGWTQTDDTNLMMLVLMHGNEYHKIQQEGFPERTVEACEKRHKLLVKHSKIEHMTSNTPSGPMQASDRGEEVEQEVEQADKQVGIIDTKNPVYVADSSAMVKEAKRLVDEVINDPNLGDKIRRAAALYTLREGFGDDSMSENLESVDEDSSNDLEAERMRRMLEEIGRRDAQAAEAANKELDRCRLLDPTNSDGMYTCTWPDGCLKEFQSKGELK